MPSIFFPEGTKNNSFKLSENLTKNPHHSNKSFFKQKDSPCVSPGGKTSSSFNCCLSETSDFPNYPKVMYHNSLSRKNNI